MTSNRNQMPASIARNLAFLTDIPQPEPVVEAPTSHGVMNLTELANYAYVIGAAERNAKVRRLVGEFVAEGEARRIVATGGARQSSTDDVRDLWLEVTLTPSGTQVHWPLADLARQYPLGEFVIDHR